MILFLAVRGEVKCKKKRIKNHKNYLSFRELILPFLVVNLSEKCLRSGKG